MDKVRIFKERLASRPVICSVRSEEGLREVLSFQDPRCVFLLGFSIQDVVRSVSSLTSRGHMPFVHMDLVEGLKSDQSGIRYLVDNARPWGIISTHKGVIEIAKGMGLMTVLRVFLLDSDALRKGRSMVSSVKPDFLEVLPGVAVVGMERTRLSDLGCPIIAGGLVDSPSQVQVILSRGVLGVSSSERSLW
ncbi:glycerol-3-phosphate responsive antiterminator (mRNA-binding) [Thermanaerovibrio velox DSM 12556]|uniref:Glycerol-3-phosphate responsive antiterminator (MRNA-binding) n=1 Tax=Thermanaerovibrio velox DSM 12556 TaxID=926567 RepID=H0UNI6_9BACT|nr:glycerol-3-phosphate responsive antiterminator (mRNA-binding) [Thermanaerovibrio velox DSM 12556]